MFIMFTPFLGYLKSKQSLFKSYLVDCSLFILLCKLYFSAMQRLLPLCFSHFNAMQNICELYVKTMFIMFAPFLGYLKAKQTLFKSYLVNCSQFHFTM